MSTEPTRAELLAWHPFELDRFQEEALEAIDADSSVLVAAPTGSGKTVVAEYAVDRALARGGKAFYTTPIKALSNQKHLDLRRRHGEGKVGLLTGDTSLAGEAPAVVMTTEVLRNMLYEGSSTLNGLSVVVLDEVHYLQDPYRGPVWEEVVLHLAADVRLVCLSATVSNAEELAAWLSSVRGPTEVIVEHHRPVDLHQQLAVADRFEGELHTLPILRGRQPNPDGARLDAAPGPRRGRARPRWATPRRDDLIELLAERELLPAIWFIFSRAGCEEAAQRARRDGIRLASPEDRPRIRAIVEHHTATLADHDLDVLGYDQWLDGLELGIAAHHAGMVPAFKEAVEQLFLEGLVRLVFATETLALGVNLPARAVVIEQLSKFRGDGHEILTPSEFTQLTGRAGRRGLDPEGHAVVMWSPFVTFGEVAALAASREFELRSAFRPTYNMAANLVRRLDREAAHELLGRSFGQFQADRSVVEVSQRHVQRRERRDALRTAASCEAGDVHEYAAVVGSLRELERAARSARSPAASVRALRPGQVVAAPGSGTPLAVLSVTQRRGGGIRLRAVDEGGRVRTITERELTEPLESIGSVALPEPYQPREVAFRRAAGRELARFRPEQREAASADDSPALREARRAVQDHPVHACPEREAHLRTVRRLARAEREVAGLERAVSQASGSLVRRFEAVLAVLEGRGYVEGWALTERGERLARTYHECDLLVADALDAGVLDGLDPADLAAVASCLTYEHRSRTPAPPWHQQPPMTAQRIARLGEIAAQLTAAEKAQQLPPTRLPDAGFARYVHQWAAGTALDRVLSERDALSAGDFVRNVKILIDLLRQIATLAPLASTQRSAAAAASALQRGVVAAGSIATDAPAEDDPDGGAPEAGNPDGGAPEPNASTEDGVAEDAQ